MKTGVKIVLVQTLNRVAPASFLFTRTPDTIAYQPSSQAFSFRNFLREKAWERGRSPPRQFDILLPSSFPSSIFLLPPPLVPISGYKWL